MEAVDKRKIRANYVQLVRNLNPEDVTDYLYQEGVLTEEDIERIMAEPVRAEKVRVLLSILPLRSREGLTKLLEAMNEHGYCELVDKIEGTVDTGEQLGINKNKELSKSVIHLHLVELKDQLEEQSQFVKALQCELEEGQELKEDLEGVIQNEEAAKKELVERVYNAAQQELRAEIATASESIEELELPSSTTTVTDLPPHIKCLVVGDGGSGKTCLLSSYITGSFPSEYYPTVFDYYKKTESVMYNKISTDVVIDFHDTAGQEDYDRLRPLAYPQTDVALITFSYAAPETLDNVLAKWLPEIQHHLPGVPYILVGTMADLCDDQQTIAKLQRTRQKIVTQKTANMVAQTHNFAGRRVYSTSALTQSGLKKLMAFVILTGLEYESRREVKRSLHKNRCSIL